MIPEKCYIRNEGLQVQYQKKQTNKQKKTKQKQQQQQHKNGSKLPPSANW